MMNLKTLFNEAVYGTIGYIQSIEDIHLLERYILYNLPVLKEFKQIVVATNYKQYPDFSVENTNLWKKYFPNCIILDSKINRGHQIGTADLDDMIVDYCKENNIEWLCKSANDVIIQSKILERKVDAADFYYLNGIGYGGAAKYDFDPTRILNEYLIDVFFPQTNFYIINVSKIDFLNNRVLLDYVYTNVQNTGSSIWDFGFQACEDMLRVCVERNNLSKYHLVSNENFIILLNIIKHYNIHDGSHKNILIEDICHLHFSDRPVIEI